MLSINTNVFSLTAQAALSNNTNPLQTAMERLSTGLRINSAADDAAGLAIATGMQSQVNGMNTAITNSNNGVGLLQTAQGALTSITNNLQSIRELAVESANSTNTPQDRTALNTEAQQLIQEIDRVASSTQFNNVNLLDGSFTNASFQVGANAGQTITIASITSARTSALTGTATTYSAAANGTAENVTGASAAPLTALAAGDMTINKVAVGSSVAGTATADQTANSAWAIANAINAAPGTGVTATANATTVGTGSAPAAAMSAGAMTINGISIGSSATLAPGGSSVAAGAAIANAINLLTTQTGVTATSDSVTGKVTLKDAEGGNIVVAGGSSFGTGSSGTYQGTVTLGAKAGSITVAGNSASSSGISSGTYTTEMSGVSASSAPSVLNYGDLTINGVTVNSPTAGGAGQTADSAWAIANAINSLGTTGVTATANSATTGALGSATAFTAISSGTFSINGVAIGTGSAAIAATTDGVQEGAAVANAINLQTSETGVTANADSITGQITLTAADGRDISVSSGGSTFGLGGAATYQGSITLSSTGSSGIVVGGNSASSAGLTSGTYAANANSQITNVAGIDITTAAGATSAMTTIDSALNSINLSNASLGAYQNRFESAVTTLQNTSNNLTSAKSNIMDADYAVETSNLTKSMIAQQAGIAVLSQANTIPQQILSLLPKG
jgi:flagellin